MIATKAEEGHFWTCLFLLFVHCSVEQDSPNLDIVNQKLNQLKAQFQKARDCVEKLPGTQYSKEEQLRRLAIFHKQVVLKTSLLQKYKEKGFLTSTDWGVFYFFM